MNTHCYVLLVSTYNKLMHNTEHADTDVVSVIYSCRQIIPGIGIGTRYRYRSRPKVLVSEVSVNYGIGLTLIKPLFQQVTTCVRT